MRHLNGQKSLGIQTSHFTHFKRLVRNRRINICILGHCYVVERSVLLQFAVQNYKFTRQLLNQNQWNRPFMSLNSLLAYGVKLKRIWSTYMNIEKRTTLAPISANKLHEPFGNLPTNLPAIFSNMNDVHNNTSYITNLQIVRVTAVQNLLYWELLKRAIFWLDKTCHM